MDRIGATAELDLTQFRGYPIHLDAFEGPLDLLLHLCEKARIEITEISVSEITRQYLDYLATLQALNIEVAGDFLVMAANLLRMKSRTLLPVPSFVEEEEGEEPMTREGLIARLLEYRRFRKVAASLREKESREAGRYPRGSAETLDPGFRLPLRQPRLFDLIEYFNEVMHRSHEEVLHEVQLEEVALEDQIDWVAACLDDPERLETLPGTRNRAVRFHRLLRRRGSRMELVVTLLAVLEMAKLLRLRLWQEESFGEIWVEPGGGESAEVSAATA